MRQEGARPSPRPRPVPEVLERLANVACDLDALECPWALVGGLALGVRARPRATLDADVAVGFRGDADVDALAQALRERGYLLLEASTHPTQGHVTTLRAVSPVRESGRLAVDLLFASTGIEAEIVAAAERIEVAPGLMIPVATRAHLIAMKVLSKTEERLQDLADLQQLLLRASRADLEEARRALRLIEDRKHDRGKALVAEFEDAVARFGPERA